VASKSQVDKLGERLKAGALQEDDLRLLDEYRRVGEPLGDGGVESPLRADIEEFHRNGFALLEQQKQRQVAASSCWSALKNDVDAAVNLIDGCGGRCNLIRQN